MSVFWGKWPERRVGIGYFQGVVVPVQLKTFFRKPGGRMSRLQEETLQLRPSWPTPFLANKSVELIT